jgi:F0F1-type ATP synthase delta subunit
MVSGKVTDKSALIQRIGEQKTTLENLIALLTKYYQQEGYTEFIDALIDLASEFDKMEMTYTYQKPTTDEANKLTTINCTTTVKLSDELLKTITEKAAALRNSVIQ